MTPIDLQQDFFSLFGLPMTFALDAGELERRFLALQAQVHPDKFTHLPEAERRLSVQWATHVNEAYQTLRKPLQRARYLLIRHGVDTQEESNTAMPVDFLMQQMEWREALEEAKRARDEDALDALEQRVRNETRSLQQQVAQQLDDAQDYAAASGTVRKLRFLEKLAEEIAAAYDEIDS